jgi:YafQ family addiction module toxin component
MFNAEYSKDFLKSIDKLSKKDKTLAIEIHKKIVQIISSDETSIEHYKNLKEPLNKYKRTHVGSFVIIFQVQKNTIYFEKFQHHDTIYDFNS